jgi:SNF related kinase
MKLVQHPNVVRLYEVIDTQTKLYLILELADGGDLYDYIMRHDDGLGEDKARNYFRQVKIKENYSRRFYSFFPFRLCTQFRTATSCTWCTGT